MGALSANVLAKNALIKMKNSTAAADTTTSAAAANSVSGNNFMFWINPLESSSSNNNNNIDEGLVMGMKRDVEMIKGLQPLSLELIDRDEKESLAALDMIACLKESLLTPSSFHGVQEEEEEEEEEDKDKEDGEKKNMVMLMLEKRAQEDDNDKVSSSSSSGSSSSGVNSHKREMSDCQNNNINSIDSDNNDDDKTNITKNSKKLKSDQQYVDSWSLPDWLNAVDPYAYDGFQCMQCGQELANRC
jgi:hypothetical protein